MKKNKKKMLKQPCCFEIPIEKKKKNVCQYICTSSKFVAQSKNFFTKPLISSTTKNVIATSQETLPILAPIPL